MSKKIGPKELALKAQREEALDIPPILRRTETPEQAEKRRKKYERVKEDFTLKVIEPVDPKIRKAIEKDLKDDVTDIPWKEMTGADLVKDFVVRGQKAQAAVDAITKPKKEKKLPSVVMKALAEKQKLENLTKTPMESTVKKAKAKKVNSPKKANGIRQGSKLEKVVALLKRREGCTTADVLKATGWPSVSMPQQAKAAGLTLKKEKVDGVTHYKVG